jgi:RNA polymerase primary sigma factor
MADLDMQKNQQSYGNVADEAGAKKKAASYEEDVSSNDDDFEDDDVDVSVLVGSSGKRPKNSSDGEHVDDDDSLTDHPGYFGGKQVAKTTGTEVASDEEPAAPVSTEYGRTDDPVRMYLREMGNVELLTREGEIEIAKRIEAGKLAMNDALFTSPSTYGIILAYADKVASGDKFLRDIVDLNAAMGIQEDVPEDDEDVDADTDTDAVETKEASAKEAAPADVIDEDG